MSRYALKRFKDGQALARHVAGLCLDRIEERAAARSASGATRFSLALSGGRIATVFFSALVAEAGRRARSASTATWLSRVNFFWADERCVPPDHPDSNYKAAAQYLLEPLQVAPERIHRIKGELPPEMAAAEATADIQASLGRDDLRGSAGGFGLAGRLPQLDLVLLGMGEDGHVASLFPDTTQCSSLADVYCHVRGPKLPPDRVTLSYAMIGAAKEAWVLVAGAGKENALADSLAPDGATPLARVIRCRPITQIFAEAG
jgi:6-phosphogluconolactonase